MNTNNQKNPRNRKVFSRLCSIACCLLLFLACTTPAYAANEIMEWDAFEGIKDLITDVTEVAMWLLPAIAGAYVIYCLIRRSIASDEGGDAHMWNKKIKTAIICGVAGGAVSGLISLLSNYVS